MKKLLFFIALVPSVLFAGTHMQQGDAINVTSIQFPNGTIQVSSPTAGGGGGTPSGNSGNIQFNNAGSFGGTDNLFWNNTNFRLGIGTNAPECQIEQKSATASQLGLIFYWNTVIPTDTILFGRYRFGDGTTDTFSFGYRGFSTDSGADKNGFVWRDSNASEVMKLDETRGRLHIASTTAEQEGTANLNVYGNALIGSSINGVSAPTDGLYVQGNTTIAGSTLSVNGLALTYPSSDGTNGQVLTTNGSKVLSFTTVSGGGGSGVSVYNSTATAGFPFGFTASTESTTGDVQIGTNVAAARLTVLKTTEQLRLMYDVNNYNSFTTASDGGMSFDSVGSGGGKFTFQDAVQVNGFTAINGSAIIGGTTSLGNKLDIVGSNVIVNIADNGAGTGYCLFKLSNTANTTYAGVNDNSGSILGAPANATILGNNSGNVIAFSVGNVVKERINGNGSVEFTSSVTVRAQGINASHIDISSTTPTLSSCGTSPAIVGNDMVGKITIGGGVVTSCTVTFAATWVNAPSCSVTAATFITGQSASTTTAALTVTGTATFNGDTVMYQCMGYQ